MPDASPSFYQDCLTVWSEGGWLMLPLFLLAIFIYYTALDLYLRLSTHFLMRAKVYQYTDKELEAARHNPDVSIQPLLLEHCHSTVQVRRHFLEVRNEYLPIINRRIRFLAIITTTGPLVGLLGTVSGMLSTFNGMVVDQGDKFDNVVEGISEALITTQTGLVISIPALIILSFIIQRRNRLERCIARLEYFNVKIAKPKLTVT